MNFEDMPELKWHWGYSLALLIIMFFIGVSMLVYLRKKKWI
jgi:magnesium transporter